MRQIVCWAALACLAAPVAAAQPKGAKAPPAKPAAKPAPKPAPAGDPDVLSTGKETILVDHLKAESPTIVLFYRPGNEEDQHFLEGLQERAKNIPKIGLRYVRLPSLDAPVAKQYEVDEAPVAFVYDRNKNLLGKARTMNQLGALALKGMHVARIKWVDESDPSAAQTYRIFGGGQRPVPEIMKTMSLKPEAMEMIAEIAGRFHFADDFLTRKDHEMVATYVSALNKCKY